MTELIRSRAQETLRNAGPEAAWDYAAAFLGSSDIPTRDTAAWLLRQIAPRMSPAGCDDDRRLREARLAGIKRHPRSAIGEFEFPGLGNNSRFLPVRVTFTQAEADLLPAALDPKTEEAIRAALDAARGLTGERERLQVVMSAEVTGTSLGLAVGLAAISRLQNLALEDTRFVATGALSAKGLVSEVEGFERKLQVLKRDRPKATMLVPSDFGSGEGLAPVATLEEAKRLVWELDPGEQRRALDEYRRHWRQKFATVPRKGLRREEVGGVGELHGAFVELEVRLEDSPADPVPFLEACAEHGALILLGGAGAGKSTSLESIVRRCCDDLDGPFANRLPVHVSLARYASELDSTPHLDLRAHVRRNSRNWAKRHRQPGLPEGVDAEHARGSIVYLLDGVDEIEIRNLRDRVLRELADLELENRGNRFIVSSRPEGLGVELGQRWKRARLQPLTFGLRHEFIYRHFKAARSQQSIGSDLAVQFGNLLERDRLTWELASNPLMLSLLLILAEEAPELPRKRADVLYSVLELFFESWSGRRRDLAGERQRNGTAEEKIASWSEVSFQSFVEGERGLIAEERACRRLDAALVKNTTLALTGRALWQEGTEAGLLRRVPGRRAQFFHLSIHEFLTAIHVARDPQAFSQLLSRVDQPEWAQVVSLCLAYLEQVQQDSEAASERMVRLLEEVTAPNEDLMRYGFTSVVQAIAREHLEPQNQLAERLIVEAARLATVRPYRRFVDLAIELFRALPSLSSTGALAALQPLIRSHTQSLRAEVSRLIATLPPSEETASLAREVLVVAEKSERSARFHAATVLARADFADAEVLDALGDYWSEAERGVAACRAAIQTPAVAREIESACATGDDLRLLAAHLVLAISSSQQRDSSIEWLVEYRPARFDPRDERAASVAQVLSYLAREDRQVVVMFAKRALISADNRSRVLNIFRIAQGGGSAVASVLGPELDGSDWELAQLAREVLNRTSPILVEQFRRRSRPKPGLASHLLSTELPDQLQVRLEQELLAAFEHENLEVVDRSVRRLWSHRTFDLDPIQSIALRKSEVERREFPRAWSRMLLYGDLPIAAEGHAQLECMLFHGWRRDVAVANLKQGLRAASPEVRLRCAKSLRCELPREEILSALDDLLDASQPVVKFEVAEMVLTSSPSHDRAMAAMCEALFRPLRIFQLKVGLRLLRTSGFRSAGLTRRLLTEKLADYPLDDQTDLLVAMILADRACFDAWFELLVRGAELRVPLSWMLQHRERPRLVEALVNKLPELRQVDEAWRLAKDLHWSSVDHPLIRAAFVRQLAHPNDRRRFEASRRLLAPPPAGEYRDAVVRVLERHMSGLEELADSDFGAEPPLGSEHGIVVREVKVLVQAPPRPEHDSDSLSAMEVLRKLVMFSAQPDVRIDALELLASEVCDVSGLIQGIEGCLGPSTPPELQVRAALWLCAAGDRHRAINVLLSLMSTDTQSRLNSDALGPIFQTASLISRFTSVRLHLSAMNILQLAADILCEIAPEEAESVLLDWQESPDDSRAALGRLLLGEYGLGGTQFVEAELKRASAGDAEAIDWLVAKHPRSTRFMQVLISGLAGGRPEFETALYDLACGGSLDGLALQEILARCDSVVARAAIRILDRAGLAAPELTRIRARILLESHALVAMEMRPHLDEPTRLQMIDEVLSEEPSEWRYYALKFLGANREVLVASIQPILTGGGPWARFNAVTHLAELDPREVDFEAAVLADLALDPDAELAGRAAADLARLRPLTDVEWPRQEARLIEHGPLASASEASEADLQRNFTALEVWFQNHPCSSSRDFEKFLELATKAGRPPKVLAQYVGRWSISLERHDCRVLTQIILRMAEPGWTAPTAGRTARGTELSFFGSAPWHDDLELLSEQPMPKNLVAILRLILTDDDRAPLCRLVEVEQGDSDVIRFARAWLFHLSIRNFQNLV